MLVSNSHQFYANRDRGEECWKFKSNIRLNSLGPDYLEKCALPCELDCFLILTDLGDGICQFSPQLSFFFVKAQ